MISRAKSFTGRASATTQTARNLHRLLGAHPLTSTARAAAWVRYCRWQAVSRFAPGPIAIPFVNDAVLLGHPGAHAANGNHYFGIYEFEEMALVGHALRPADLFLDVGANIGSYSMLAIAAAGASALALEPVPQTFQDLQRNARINDFGDRISCLRAAATADGRGVVMTADRGAMNRVVSEPSQQGDQTETVPGTTLDSVTAERCPAVMKIDVEGFEREVLAGAKSLLASPGLHTIVLETDEDPNGACSAGSAIGMLRAAGLSPIRYDPISRSVRSEATPTRHGNVLFTRDMARLQSLVHEAPPFRVLGRDI